MMHLNDTALIILHIFIISVLGYALGRVKCKGICLGAAGVFIVALLFGYLGVQLPSLLQTMGLILFTTSIGISTGPGFLRRLVKNGYQYVLLCMTTTLIGCLVCLIVVRVFHVTAPLAVGIMTGAYTTSPGFAAAKEAVSADQTALVAAGYGMAYPVGVISKVLFIQIMPRLLHVDMEQERAKIHMELPEKARPCAQKKLRMDKSGFFPFSLAAVLGIFMGAIRIPLSGGASFSLGYTGGPLIAGLLVGGLGGRCPVDLRVDKTLTNSVQELGLILFFSGAGVEGGHGLGQVVAEYGMLPLAYAFAFVMLPLLAGYVMFHRVLKMPLLNGLGCMTASMTCTPSLAVLIQTAETDDVAAAYATTYPIALITLILTVQFLITL